MSQVFLITAKDEETAQKIYDYKVKTMRNPEEGEKNGIEYTLSYEVISGTRNPVVVDTSDAPIADENTHDVHTIVVSDMPTDNDAPIVECGFASGIYIKGNTVVWIYSVYDVNETDECVKTFCDKLNLESPYSLS